MASDWRLSLDTRERRGLVGVPASRTVLRSGLVSGVLAAKVFGRIVYRLGSTVVAHCVLHAFATVAVDGALNLSVRSAVLVLRSGRERSTWPHGFGVF